MGSAPYSIGTWVWGEYLETSASTANWQEFTVPSYPGFAPLFFNIAARSGVQEVHASSGAVLQVTGGVGSAFVFPDTPEWSNLSWIAIYTVSGSIGIDDLWLSVCPQPDIAGPLTVDEGAAVLLNASVEGLTPAYAWDLDGDGQYDDSTNASPLFDAAQLDGPTSVPIGLSVSADCGGAGIVTLTDAATISVDNVAPAVAPLSGPTTLGEGAAGTWTGSFTDPGVQDTHSIAWDLGDGGAQAGALSTTHSYGDAGTYVLSLTVTDDDGGVGTASLTVDVTNEAPVIVSSTIPSGLEGQALSFAATGSDASGDPLTWTWNFGDGTGTHPGASVSHTFLQDGNYSVTVTVQDDDGGVTTHTETVTITDVPPTITSFAVPAVSTEGAVVAVTSAATDPGADTLTHTWSWGDGTPNSTGLAPTHSFPDDGSFLVTLTVSDQSGVTVQQAATIEVANVAPVIDSVALPSGDEGSLLPFVAVLTDPGADPLIATWTFGDGASALGASVTHAYGDEGSWPVSLVVDDGDGGTATFSGTVTVANVPPTVLALVGDSSGPEGALLNWTALVDEPGADTLSWSFGDGGTASTGPSQSHAFAADGTYTVSVTVDDGDGGSDSGTLVVTVSNDIPTITSMSAPGGPEGQSLTFAASAVDPGGDPLSYTWTFGDGGVGTGANPTHTYDDDGAYTVQLVVADLQGASASRSELVTVTNVAPTLSPAVGPLVGDEGASLSWSTSGSDVSVADTANLIITWDWGDGTAASVGETVSHAFADDGAYSVTLQADDGDGGTATQTFAVTIANVAPSFDSAAPTEATEGVLYGWTPSVLEPGTDPLTFALTTGPATMTVDPSTGQLAWTPAYLDSTTGAEPVALEVTDGDGGADSLSWTIDVLWTDADADGMADGWEVANDLDPSSASDATEDGDQDGLSNLDEFLAGTDPAVFDGPSATVLSTPLDGDEVPTRPTLAAVGAVDPQGDALTLTFEVYADNELVDLLDAGDVPQSGDATSWSVTVDLPENADAWWRARASDPFTSGPWSEVRRVFVNGLDEAPAAPQPVYPVGGELVAVATPRLEWAPAIDPDRDALSYSVSLWTADGAEVSEASGLPAGEDPVISWVVDVPLDEDVEYLWEVTAVDPGGASAGSDPQSFLHSQANGAPTGVVWLAPADGSEITDPAPTLVASEGIDPEGGLVGHLFEFAATPTFDDPAYVGRQVASDGSGTVSWELAEGTDRLPVGTVYARVRGVDEEGAASAPETVTFTVLDGSEAPPGCADCSATIARSGRLSPVLVAAAVFWMRRRRWRSRA